MAPETLRLPLCCWHVLYIFLLPDMKRERLVQQPSSSDSVFILHIWGWKVIGQFVRLKKTPSWSAAALHLQRWISLRIQVVWLHELLRAHFIIMELCHAGLKALLMNNYRAGKEHGSIQNKEEVQAVPLSRKQVGAFELYIHRYNSGECIADFLCPVLMLAVQDE